MRKLARQIIAKELPRRSLSQSEPAYAALRVCSKLQGPLTAYAGAVGYRSLLRRALSLTRTENQWLATLEVSDAGAIVVPANSDATWNAAETAEGGEALVAQLLQLLEIFIGEALTLRLVHEVWPTVTSKTSNS